MAVLQSAGCFFKAVAGFTAFAVGGGGIVLLALPYTVGRRASDGLVAEFNRRHKGSIDVRGAHVLGVLSPQVIESIILRDPDGREIASGSLKVEGMSAIAQRGRVRLEIEIEEADIVIGPDGISNIERSFESRSNAAGDAISLPQGQVKFSTSNGEGLSNVDWQGMIDTVDLNLKRCWIRDESFAEPALLELRECAVWASGNGSGHAVAVVGTVAGGPLDLRIDGFHWSDEHGRFHCKEATARFQGNTSRSLEPWVERWTGLGPLSQQIGPTLGVGTALFAESPDGLDGAQVRLNLKGQGMDVRFVGAWSADEQVLRTMDEDGFKLSFDTGSPVERAVLPQLFPYLASFADPRANNRSVLSARSLTIPLGRERESITGEFDLDLGYRLGVPTQPFKDIAELASQTSWPIREGTLEFGVADHAVSFEVRHASESGLWTVFGNGSFAGHEVKASVHLPACYSKSGEPHILHMAVAARDGQVEPENEPPKADAAADSAIAPEANAEAGSDG